MTFALISEGPSEHRVIKNIISKYFKEYDPDINPIQPKLLDGKQDNKTPGGWNEVLKYCEREELKDIFVENDYLVIQIDTDQSQLPSFGIPHTHPISNKQKTGEELCKEVANSLFERISAEVKANYSEKIFFAICIHTIECWLLPIFYTNNHKSKTLTCIKTLNTALGKNNIHIITAANKNEPNGIKAYELALMNWKKKEDIISSSKHNEGFKMFIASLSKIKINTN